MAVLRTWEGIWGHMRVTPAPHYSEDPEGKWDFLARLWGGLHVQTGLPQP
jgi:hypothetical protein